MNRLFIFAVAAALSTDMSAMAWSRPGVGSDGYNPFNDSRIRRQLNLSQDQIRQLRALNNDWRKQLQRLRRGEGNNVNSADQAQRSRMSKQYATMVNGVLTAQQQQALSQLIGQLNANRPNTTVPRTSTVARTTKSNFRAGMASAGQTSTTSSTARSGTNAVPDSGPGGTQQANAGGGSSAVGTAAVTGQPAVPNSAGPTQGQGGGGSSEFGTAAVTGVPVVVTNNSTGPTQAQGGGGSSAFGTAAVTGVPVVATNNSTGPTQAQGGGGSSAFGTAAVTGVPVTGTHSAGATQAQGGGGSSAFGTAAVTGVPVVGTNNSAGPTQAQGGGGSSAFGTAAVTGVPVTQFN
jgi:hypothetical protein